MFGPQKRKYQEKLNKLLIEKENFSRGTVLGLAGPEPEKQLKDLITLGIGDWYHLFEISLDRFLAARDKIYNNKLNNVTDINHKDIFLYPGHDSSIDISGIDLDFCECFRKDLAIQTGLWLEKILAQNTLDHVWLRVTSSIGLGCGKAQMLNRFEKIVHYLNKNTNWQWKSMIYYTYRDTRSMIVQQVQFLRKGKKMDYTMTRKDYEMKKRTMKDLTETQKDRIRERMFKGENPEVIGKQYNLTKMSVAALKAWRTMGAYNVVIL